MFESLFLKTDVTAVKIWKDFVFVSIGGFFGLYELNSLKLLYKMSIFNGQKIHGFHLNAHGTRIVIYGGRNIAIVSIKEQCEDIKILNSKVLSDWILEAKWIENNMKLCTIFMHNKITIWSDDIIPEVSVKCAERCILYSAHICFNKYQDLIILSGTVFSEVLLWKPCYKTNEGFSPVLKRLKQHKGVIFSLKYDSSIGFICSTSDDRSAIVWTIKNKEILPDLNPENSNNLNIVVNCQVFGHLSRVFRCFIFSDFFATAGEDSQVIIWNMKGEMVRKIDTHQGGPIWALDYDVNRQIVCSGGNDGGVCLFKLNPTFSSDKITLPDGEIPRTLGFLHSGIIVCLSESATLYLFQKSLKTWEKIDKLDDLQNYSLMQISACRKQVALAGFNGQIYIYFCNKNKLIKVCSYNLQTETRIFAFHWLTCSSFLICQNDGQLQFCFLYKNNIYPIQTFILPPSKERWSTSACLLNNHIIVGDRKGNVYNFRIGCKDNINSIKKAHNHLGVARLYTKDNIVTSLGRDGILKRYQLVNDNLQILDSHKTKFSWLAALEENYLFSFNGNSLILSDFKYQRILFENHCGGGHRSWDYFNNSQVLNVCFIKNKCINIIELTIDDFMIKNIIEGYHVNEINCLKVIGFNSEKILISGGEDTVLRLSVLDNHLNFKVIEHFKVHLSNIRSMCLHRLPQLQSGVKKIDYLLFTGGGRGQIICWYISINCENLYSDFLLLECSEKFNFYEPLGQDKAETRIMDLCLVDREEKLFLFSGCSDGSIKVFSVDDKTELKFQTNLFCSFHAITKLDTIFIDDNTIVLLSMNTNGNMMFWDVSNALNFSNSSPINSVKVHQSGINSYSIRIINKNSLLILSGGDDNSIVLTLFKISFEENINIDRISFFENVDIHCAQITGAYLTDSYFITSAIDQRVVVWKYNVLNDDVSFKYVHEYNTTVSDPQGLECTIENRNLHCYIYGVGVEIIKINIQLGADKE